MLLDEGFPLPQWSKESHLSLMKEAGITTSILTLPVPHPYFGDKQECAEVCRQLNEELYELTKITNGKEQAADTTFRFCATLPLPDVDAAIAEAIYALDTLGAVGVKLATNVYEQYLGDSVLDPLMKFLSDRHALVILHPHKPAPINNEVMAQTPLAMQEYLSETTRAVCNMISRNVLACYPDMRIVVPHAGAYLPIAIPRMKSLYPVMKMNGLVGDIDFEKNVNCLYFDLAGSPSEATIEALLTITTQAHLLYGSDYPYVSPQVIKNNMPRMRKYLDSAPQNSKQNQVSENKQMSDNHIVRIAEIRVYKKYLSDYLKAASRVGQESVEKENGVVCIFPMQVKNEPNTIRIVEIYKDSAAYQSHLHTPHFLEYKQSTLHMVKSL